MGEKLKLWEKLRGGKRGMSVQTGRERGHPFAALESYLPLGRAEHRLYESIREAVPLVDAALDRIGRLVGSFVLLSEDPRVAGELAEFARRVKVAGGGVGLRAFLDRYLDDLLTYGNAAGEMLPGRAGEGLAGLYNAPLENLRVEGAEDFLTPRYRVRNGQGSFVPAARPELILFTPLRPAAGEWEGRSLLGGLPFVSDILLKIYRSVGNNFERVANLRYAVTYRPGSSPVDRAYSGEIAKNLADEWTGAMEGSKNGVIRDFVAVGDVDIKVIGADNQMLDTQVPVRQMLEQMVAKLGVPPFILGLQWSSTERMSSQQADILTSELEYYRGLLTPVVEKICRTHLARRGLGGAFTVEWENINLQDEVALANARLLQLQARELEERLDGGEMEEEGR